jgi:hypothetical protein
MLRSVLLALSIVAAQSAAAQDALGVGDVMAACTPTGASGPSIRAELTAAGWTAQTPQNGRQDLRDLLGSHVWGIASDTPLEDQPALIDLYVPAFVASLNDPEFGQIYTRQGAVAVILSQGVNLSCFWAGPESATFAAQVESIGGFPQAQDSSVTSATRTQTVEAGGQDWTRIESYATLTQDGRIGPDPAAARLDRSPV